jgi:hypothetical protein
MGLMWFVITIMWMECEPEPAHLFGMVPHDITKIADPELLLGQKAKGRNNVDLIAEAVRLKFSELELLELRRLYQEAQTMAPLETMPAKKPETPPKED